MDGNLRRTRSGAPLQQTYGRADPCRVSDRQLRGGFGPKMEGTPEEMLLPWLAKQVGRPVRFVETRTENMTAMGHGRDQIQYLAIGGSRDGTVQAYRIEVLGNAGAYCMLGGFLAFFTHVWRRVYDIQRSRPRARSLHQHDADVSYRVRAAPKQPGDRTAIGISRRRTGMTPSTCAARTSQIVIVPRVRLAGGRHGCMTRRLQRSLVLVLEGRTTTGVAGPEQNPGRDVGSQATRLGVSCRRDTSGTGRTLSKDWGKKVGSNAM